MVLGIQVIGIAFASGVLYLSFLNYKRREFTVNEFAFWSAFAALFGFVALFPNLLEPVLVSLSLQRAMDLFIILGFMFMTAGLFYVYQLVRRLQKSHEELVRKIALQKKR